MYASSTRSINATQRVGVQRHAWLVFVVSLGIDIREKSHPHLPRQQCKHSQAIERQLGEMQLSSRERRLSIQQAPTICKFVSGAWPWLLSSDFLLAGFLFLLWVSRKVRPYTVQVIFIM